MDWIFLVELFARLILVFLVFLSVWSLKVLIEKWRFFKSLEIPFDQLRERIKNKKDILSLHHYFSDIFNEMSQMRSADQIQKIFDSYVVLKRKEMDKGLSILGTLGSITPFIGLLGTILGIIVSFGELSKGAGSSNTVMYSLAEALVLTAAGLMVAIPAVVSFNFYTKKIKSILGDLESLKDLFLAYRD
jgi:biopolymer transport protein ExbB/TolQ